MPIRRAFSFAVVAAAFLFIHVCWSANAAVPPAGDIPGVRMPSPSATQRTTAQLMKLQSETPARAPHPDHELEYPDRSNLPGNPDAIPTSRFPVGSGNLTPHLDSFKSASQIHTTAASWDGATLTDTGAFPPDSMGTVGPTQFVVFVNGRIRSFTKAGVADGVLNADPDVFFASVMACRPFYRICSMELPPAPSTP